MDDNDNEQVDPIEIKPTGVPQSVVIVLCALLALAGFAALGKPGSATCEANSSAMAANATAQKAQIEYQTACVKRDSDLRLEVVKQCVAKGNIPVFMGGNVDCKPAPK